MKALTVRARAYLAGALRGDAWLGAPSGGHARGYLGLRVADEEFAQAFAVALRDGFDVVVQPRRDERGYWLVRTYNGHGRFDVLRDLPVDAPTARGLWLRGLFDSEGNALLLPKPRSGPRSFDRRVAFYSTDEGTLALAGGHLSALGIMARRGYTASPDAPGHKGSRPVRELLVAPGAANYRAFGRLVGSSIPRKVVVLDALPGSYCADPSEVRREMQAAGVATRLARKAAGGRY